MKSKSKIIVGSTEYGSVLEALGEERIFSVAVNENGFCFTEECDNYFDTTISKEQMLMLAAEIVDLANSADSTPAKGEPPTDSA